MDQHTGYYSPTEQPRSRYLQDIIKRQRSSCNIQIVYVDITSYSRRKPHAQVELIAAFKADIEQAVEETEGKYVKYTRDNHVEIRRDIVVLPSGDGVAIGFPFNGLNDIHLVFACQLLKIIHDRNTRIACPNHDFARQGWCDCCEKYHLRIGISEGRLTLYEDLNGKFNVAGKAINMAARVMDLANADQIFLTSEAFDLVTGQVKEMNESKFRLYTGIRIKHNSIIDTYQFIDNTKPGLDCSVNPDLQSASAAIRAALTDPEYQGNESDGLEPQPGASAEISVATESNTLTKLRAEMVTVPAGVFKIKGNNGQVEARISQNFMLSRHLVTQAIYEELMGTGRSAFTGEAHPVEGVNWFEAVDFCNRLSEHFDLQPVYRVLGNDSVTADFKNSGFRLPTETEWEYACRAGGTQGDCYGILRDIAWYNENSRARTHAVGQKEPNALGLYDMLGNVWEWCHDRFGLDYPVAQADYAGPASGPQRVIRGGAFNSPEGSLRAGYRFRESPRVRNNNIGFRVALNSSH